MVRLHRIGLVGSNGSDAEALLFNKIKSFIANLPHEFVEPERQTKYFKLNIKMRSDREPAGPSWVGQFPGPNRVWLAAGPSWVW